MLHTGEHGKLAPHRGSLGFLEHHGWSRNLAEAWEKSQCKGGAFIWIHKIYVDVGASFICALQCTQQIRNNNFLSSHNTCSYLKGNVKVFIFIRGVQHFFSFSRGIWNNRAFKKAGFTFLSLPAPNPCTAQSKSCIDRKGSQGQGLLHSPACQESQAAAGGKPGCKVRGNPISGVCVMLIALVWKKYPKFTF